MDDILDAAAAGRAHRFIFTATGAFNEQPADVCAISPLVRKHDALPIIF